MTFKRCTFDVIFCFVYSLFTLIYQSLSFDLNNICIVCRGILIILNADGVCLEQMLIEVQRVYLCRAELAINMSGNERISIYPEVHVYILFEYIT